MALTNWPMADVPTLNHFARQMTRPQGKAPEKMAADLETGNDVSSHRSIDHPRSTAGERVDPQHRSRASRA